MNELLKWGLSKCESTFFFSTIENTLQVTVCYDDFFGKTTEERRKHLENNFYFVCNCLRCTSPEPLAACTNLKCRYNCGPDDKKCHGCGQQFPSDFKTRFEQVIAATEKLSNEEKEGIYCLKAYIGRNVKSYLGFTILFEIFFMVQCLEFMTNVQM